MSENTLTLPLRLPPCVRPKLVLTEEDRVEVRRIVESGCGRPLNDEEYIAALLMVLVGEETGRIPIEIGLPSISLMMKEIWSGLTVEAKWEFDSEEDAVLFKLKHG